MPGGVQGWFQRPGIGRWWKLAALWLAAQGFLLWRLGIRTGGDTGRYVEAAETLLGGQAPAGKATWYLGYDLFVAVFTGSGLGLSGVVAAQVALSALAAYCLYRLATRLYDARVGVLAALFYIVYPEIQMWNFYILTESLFVSLTIISGWLLISAQTLGQRAAAVAVLLFAATVRPHGLALLAAAMAYTLSVLWRRRRYAVVGACFAALAVLAPVALGAIGGLLGQERLVEHYAEGTVIWGYEAVRIAMPGDLPPSVTDAPSGVRQVVAFVLAKPAYFLRLAVLKLGYEYLHARPYYSLLHNGFLLATLLPAYALAVWGALRPSGDPSAKVLLLALVGAQSLAISLSFADWDGRHILVILPVVFVFAAAASWDLWAWATLGRSKRAGS